MGLLNNTQQTQSANRSLSGFFMHTYWLNKRGTISCAHKSPLTGKTPAELIVMNESRQALQTLLTTPEVIAPDLIKAIETALRHRSRRMAPFMPLNAEQRLGWLDEAACLICSNDMAGCFTAGLTYAIRTSSIIIKHLIERKSIYGGLEEVLITGEELIVAMEDDLQRTHTFCHGDVPQDPRIYANHPLTPLIEHFHIPETPDITQIYPATYQKYKQTLALL